MLYRGRRVGRGGHFFGMLKFRTLRRGAEDRIGQYLGEELVRQTEAELTGVGRFLKASQLDEIPQLWNVIRGDMSFVGPRPIRPRFFAELAERAAGVLAAARRPARPHRVRAGPSRLRDVDGREARARPRVDRRPLGAPLSAHGGADRSARRPPVGRRALGQPLACAASAGSPQLAEPSTASASRACRRRSPTAGRTRRESHVDGGIGLAARRLAIIDLAGGDQPIANEDGTVVVVQNGEIYNHLELRGELERAGHRFATRCDTEVLVHGYEEWGARLWERLRGMFAVAVHDARSRSLVLARDPFGIKPLYYRDVSGDLSFASELDALPRGEIDLDALEAFLAFNTIPAPLSIYRDVRKLPPGHTLTWSGRGNDARRATRGRGRSRCATDADEAELVEECRARLRDSVRAHLIADVPVGVLLSGGVDSGALDGARGGGVRRPGAHVLDRVRRRRRSTSS